MKQMTFLEPEETGATKYTAAAGSPVYLPRGDRPHILNLRDTTKTHALLRAIDTSAVTLEEKAFLVAAAQRHTVFNYELIADYYAHATPEMQRLMEQSALVIVDIENAIEFGYVRLCESIRKQHMEEVAKDA